MQNNNFKLTPREVLKPYANSEKLGYICLHGTIDKSNKRLAPKGKMLVKQITAIQFQLAWAEKHRMPKVLHKTIGCFDHCFLDEDLNKYSKSNELSHPVKVVSYQRLDGSTSYTFERASRIEELMCLTLVGMLRLTLNNVRKSKSQTFDDVMSLQKPLQSLIDIRDRRMKLTGLEALAVAHLNEDIIHAGLEVVCHVVEKKLPEKKQKKKRKSFATL